MASKSHPPFVPPFVQLLPEFAPLFPPRRRRGGKMVLPTDVPGFAAGFIFEDAPAPTLTDFGPGGYVGNFGYPGIPGLFVPNPGWVPGGLACGESGEVSFTGANRAWAGGWKTVDVVCDVGSDLDQLRFLQGICRAYPLSNAPGFGSCGSQPGFYTAPVGTGPLKSAERLEKGVARGTFVADGANSKIYVNGVEVAAYYRSNDPLLYPSFDDGQALEFLSISGFTSSVGAFRDRLFYLVFYREALTLSQIRSLQPYIDSLMRSKGVAITPRSALLTPKSAPRLFALGDSLTEGANDGGKGGGGWPMRTQVGIAATNRRITNLGIFGIQATALSAELQDTVVSLLGTSGDDWVSIGVGSNGNFSTADFDAVVQLADDFLSRGVKKVLLATGYPRYVDDSARIAFNTAIRQHVKAWPDSSLALFELGAHPQIGQYGQNEDTENYSTDKVHLVTNGFDKAADDVTTPAALTAGKWAPDDIPGIKVCQVAGLLRGRGVWYQNTAESLSAYVGDPLRRGAGWRGSKDLTAPDDASRPTLVALGDGRLATQAAAGTRLLFDPVTLTGDWTAWVVVEAPSGDCVPLGNNDGGAQSYISWQGSSIFVVNDANNPVIVTASRPANTRVAIRVRCAGGSIYVKVTGQAEVNAGAPVAPAAYTFSALGWLYAGFGSVTGAKSLAEVLVGGAVSAETDGRMGAYLLDELGVAL